MRETETGKGRFGEIEAGQGRLGGIRAVQGKLGEPLRRWWKSIVAY